jgi:hypothetical protein
MTIPGFGRLTPIQATMLGLAGLKLDRRFSSQIQSAELPPDQDCIETMKRARSSLVRLTGADYGFDLAAWQDHLEAHPELGYTHPYGYQVTKAHVRAAIADPERQRVARLAAG